MKPLSQLYEADQTDRRNPELFQDFDLIAKRDAARRKLAKVIIAKRKQLSGAEYYILGMLYHHGPAITHSRLAIRYAKRACGMGNEKAKWLYAAAVDRLLSKQEESQRYGTQFIKKDAKSKWKLHPIDPSVTDEERARLNVPPIADAKAKVKRMNEDG